MARYATASLLHGLDGEIQRGEVVPETFTNSLGEQEKTDFDRLEELELVSNTKPSDEEVTPEVTVDASVEDLEKLKAKQLRELAKAKGVSPLPKKKADLIKAIAAE